MTPEEAKKVLDEEARARSDLCSRELKELLDKHSCTLDVAVTFRNGNPPEFTVKVINNYRGL